MAAVLGYAAAAAGILLREFSDTPAKRYIGDFYPQVTVEESHHDELVITDHPVEYGASISDHCYKRPAEVVIKCGLVSASPSNAGLLGGLLSAVTGTIAGVSGAMTGPCTDLVMINKVYTRFLALQASGVPFGILTWKRRYTNMLIKSLVVSNDKETFRVLNCQVTCQQIIMVETTTVSLKPSKNPAVSKGPRVSETVCAGVKAPTPLSYLTLGA